MAGELFPVGGATFYIGSAAMAKLAAKGKDGGLIGPPDPRKGRLPMTK